MGNLAVLATLCGLIYRFFGHAFGWDCSNPGLPRATGNLQLLTVHGILELQLHLPLYYEQTHGVVLSIAMISFSRWVRRDRLPWCGLAGVCLGFVFLTKAELFVRRRVRLVSASPWHHWARACEATGIALATLVGAALLPVVDVYCSS